MNRVDSIIHPVSYPQLIHKLKQCQRNYRQKHLHCSLTELHYFLRHILLSYTRLQVLYLPQFNLEITVVANLTRRVHIHSRVYSLLGYLLSASITLELSHHVRVRVPSYRPYSVFGLSRYNIGGICRRYVRTVIS